MLLPRIHVHSHWLIRVPYHLMNTVTSTLGYGCTNISIPLTLRVASGLETARNPFSPPLARSSLICIHQWPIQIFLFSIYAMKKLASIDFTYR